MFSTVRSSSGPSLPCVFATITVGAGTRRMHPRPAGNVADCPKHYLDEPGKIRVGGEGSGLGETRSRGRRCDGGGMMAGHSRQRL